MGSLDQRLIALFEHAILGKELDDWMQGYHQPYMRHHHGFLFKHLSFQCFHLLQFQMSNQLGYEHFSFSDSGRNFRKANLPLYYSYRYSSAVNKLF